MERLWRAASAARRGALTLLLLACGGTLLPAAAAAIQPAYQEVPGAIIMQLRDDVVAAMDADSHGLRWTRPAGLPNAAVYRITDGTPTADKLRQIRKHPAIKFAEPDYRVSVNWQPNDSLLLGQWHHAVVGSMPAWNSSTGRQEIKVCHLDSGVRVDHPDLAQRVVKAWNLVPEVQEFDQDSAPPDSPHYANVNDTFGHGTHTAGIIAAVGNNDLGVAGLAMDVRLLVCKFIWDDGFGSISDALECLRLCAEEGATISSNSWGGVPHSKAIQAALQEMEAAGMLFVVASGNQGVDLDTRPAFPASSGMRNMVVVGAAGPQDELSSFSNSGRKTVHLLSPGEAILSTTHNGWYGPMDGTSMACPLVAGAAALLQSAALSQGVKLSYTETKALLLASVDASPAGSAAAGASLTGGRLNVAAAMRALALVLLDRGGAMLPGLSLDDPGMPDAQQRLLGGGWAKGLLSKPVLPAPGGATLAAPAAPAAGQQAQQKKGPPQLPQLAVGGGAVLLEQDQEEQEAEEDAGPGQQQQQQQPASQDGGKGEPQPHLPQPADPTAEPQPHELPLPKSGEADGTDGAAQAPSPAEGTAEVEAQALLASGTGQPRAGRRRRMHPRLRLAG